LKFEKKNLKNGAWWWLLFSDDFRQQLSPAKSRAILSEWESELGGGVVFWMNVLNARDKGGNEGLNGVTHC
jgi:hypothetical protein